MPDKPIPEFMKEYMENIGDDCYGDYDRLAQQYHKAINHYHEHIYPGQAESQAKYNKAFGKSGELNVDAALTGIKETYKEKSLNLANEKYGYEIPDMEGYEPDSDNFGKSYQDVMAGKAHETYEAKNAITKEQRSFNKDIIEHCFGEDRVKNLEYLPPDQRQKRTDPQQEEKLQETPEIEEQLSPETVEEVPERNEPTEPTRYEQQLSSFAENQKDILNDKHVKAFKENRKDMTGKAIVEREKKAESKDSSTPELNDPEGTNSGAAKPDAPAIDKSDNMENQGRGANRFMASLSSERQQSDMDSIDLHITPKGKDTPGVDIEMD